MNIGIVTTWFERGAAYVSKQLMDTIEKGGDKVFIYARGGEGTGKGDSKWDKDYVTWGEELWLPTVATPIAKKDFLEWIENTKIDIIIFNEQHWLEPLLWCKELGVKTVAYVDYYKETTIDFFEIYDYLICNTKRHYDTFSWHPGARFIPWGTDTSVFIRSAIPSSNSFFHSSGMAPVRKGTDLLIKAYWKSKRKWKLIIHSQLPLDLIGNNDLSSIINELINEGKLEIIVKSVPAPGLYHLGTAYVYPSRLDGIGLTVAEAMACGLIPVVTDNPPMNEFSPDNYKFNIPVKKYYSRADGYYWPVSEVDVDDLTKILDEVSSLSEDEVSFLQDEAYDFAKNRLSWEKNSVKLLELIDEARNNRVLSPVNKTLSNSIIKFSRFGLNRYNNIIIQYNFILRPLFKLFKGK
ncbi:hypothetical protein N180_15355 [Pedobacter antarcticus 4BY]|uniref:Glycosyl transferase family 1 domain-containing protein n=2 Tax=Pedobacter antarcticus TaxID=34086 RepID=A0A081PE01_9SPHI|nr:glycosyltransferase family 4 protein [Pedobacter antarcticus]KEQ28924.1 hypothetical protein N180_15355 [Pedobacter antarcticus 4BY]SFF12935.1 Glycosyltransferase involved in cell wall bisynthesis [Pedobacter antarcticus]